MPAALLQELLQFIGRQQYRFDSEEVTSFAKTEIYTAVSIFAQHSWNF